MSERQQLYSAQTLVPFSFFDRVDSPPSFPPRWCTGAVRASSIFPIMSVGLLFLGGLCVAASEFYRSRHNVILSAGIFFVSAG